MDKGKKIKLLSECMENKSFVKRSQERWSPHNKRLERNVSNPTFIAKFKCLLKNKSIEAKVQNLSIICWSFKSGCNGDYRQANFSN